MQKTFDKLLEELDFHELSDPHFQEYFQGLYHGYTKTEIKKNTFQYHAFSEEIEYIEDSLNRELTEEETEILKKKFQEFILQNLEFKKGICLYYLDSEGEPLL